MALAFRQKCFKVLSCSIFARKRKASRSFWASSGSQIEAKVDGPVPKADGPVPAPLVPDGEFFLENLLVRIHFIIQMFWWTGLAPWEFEFPFPASHTSTFQGWYQLNIQKWRLRTSTDNLWHLSTFGQFRRQEGARRSG